MQLFIYISISAYLMESVGGIGSHSRNKKLQKHLVFSIIYGEAKELFSKK